MTTAPAVGDTVITWDYDGPMTYNGEHDNPLFSQLQFDLRNGGLTKIKCDPSRVAPVATVISGKDQRAEVTKMQHRPYPAGGPWALDLPGQKTTFHKTKRDALATGMRRLAILDHVARRTSDG